MGNKYFDMKDTVYDVTEKYKEAKNLLVSLVFTNIEDERKILVKLDKISIISENFRTDLR